MHRTRICCPSNPWESANISSVKEEQSHPQSYSFKMFKILKEKGAKYFGIHAFLASNTVTNEYYPKLARQLFELVVELRDKTGCDIKFINLSGGVNPYFASPGLSMIPLLILNTPPGL